MEKIHDLDATLPGQYQHASTDGSVPLSPRGDEESETRQRSRASAIESNESQHEYLTGLKLLSVMLSVTLVGFLMLLDYSIVSTAIPKITTDFHSLNDVGWYGTAYLLANCALLPLTGKMYTLISSKWTFLGFLGVFELGSAICGAAQSSTMLIIGRAIAGCGASGLLNGALTIVHSSVSPANRSFYTGMLIGASQLGLLSGPLIGGALTQHTTWRWCFYINLPCGGPVAILLFTVSIPDQSVKIPGQSAVRNILAKLDLIGFAVFSSSAIQLILTLQWGGTKYAWSSATIIGLFGGSFGMLAIFVIWEARIGDDAMISFSILKRRVIWNSCLNYACLTGSLLTTTYYLPIYFQAVRNASPTTSGVNLLPSILSTIMFGVLSGGIVGRLGYYLPFAVLSGILSTLGSGLLSTLHPSTAVRTWIGYQIIQGTGRGFGIQVPITAVQNNTSKANVSIATALIVFSQNLGGVVFLALDQIIFSTQLRHLLRKLAPDVDSARVIAAGATNVGSVVKKYQLEGVLEAYSRSFDRVMYVGTAAAGGALLFSFGMGWVNIRKEQELGKKAIQVNK